MVMRGALLVALSSSPLAQAMVRGVAPELQQQYKEGATFRCLNGEKQVPFTSVNDDYCDCSDGSDEPGTGACSGQEATLFHCENAGGTPKLVYASRVGDGICDCCDGADEAELMKRRPKGSMACTNTCAEEGEREKQEREQKLGELRVGLEAKRLAIDEAKKARKGQEADLSRLAAELPGMETKLAELKQKKAAADEIKMQQECKTEMPKLKETVKNLEDKIKKLEAEIETLSGATTTTTTKKVVSEYAKWMDGADSAMEEDDEAAAEEEGLPAAVAAESTEGAAEAKAAPVEEDPLEKELKELETKVKAAQDEKKGIEKKMADLPEDKLGFAGLSDKCLEYKTSEYTYKLCFFKDAKQSHTTLGRWDSFTSPLQASFKNGDMCWGGPARSLNVIFECGATEEITEIGEPSRCAYQARVRHPGACHEEMASALTKPPTKHPKDEL
mmetsp:Transcript_84348/g.149111  ORF Transcript_84348/g.149111 Transcript_84348/m.149111 type:complete len:445 (+) Transcript_84348:51-1385(+)